MVKHTQTFRRRRLLLTKCLCVFDHFVGLAPKALSNENPQYQTTKKSQMEKKKRGEEKLKISNPKQLHALLNQY